VIVTAAAREIEMAFMLYRAGRQNRQPPQGDRMQKDPNVQHRTSNGQRRTGHSAD
jgi:hypothetical protein